MVIATEIVNTVVGSIAPLVSTIVLLCVSARDPTQELTLAKWLSAESIG